MAQGYSLLDSLIGQLGSGGVSEIARSVGVDSQDVGNVLAGAIPAIMAGVSRNASSSAGASSLAAALDRNHDGSVLDDVIGYLSGGGNTDDGAGILGHVLGDRRTTVERSVSRSSGVDVAKVSQIMMMVAPLILGAIGKAKRSHGFDAGGLSSALGREQDTARQYAPSAVDIFSSLLDADHDGDPTDDVVKMGSELLGGLFK
jgi:hypothetical protein